MFIEKGHPGLRMTPAGVTRHIIQLFSINMQTLRVWKLPILFGAITIQAPMGLTGRQPVGVRSSRLSQGGAVQEAFAH